MPKLDLTPVRASDLTPTQWDTAADKAKFANHLLKFIDRDFPETQFPNWFYKRLSMTFGFIAHFNQGGFYGTYFRDLQGKQRFVDALARHRCYGDPTFTYSDVETIIRDRVLAAGLVEEFTNRCQRQFELNERAELARLQAKYPKAGAAARTITVSRRA